MNNVFVQLELGYEKSRLPVYDASDLCYAVEKLWNAHHSNPSYGIYIDLVNEKGFSLTEEERAEFFDQQDAQCEMALGYCWVSASLELDNRYFNGSESDYIRKLINSCDTHGVRIHFNDDRLEIVSDTIYFTSMPNTHLRHYYRYDGAENDAFHASHATIMKVNEMIADFANEIRPILNEDDELNVDEFNPEYFSFRNCQENFGDYRIVDLGNLIYDYVSI